LIGESLGPYKIIEPLGAGGMGEVYRVRDTDVRFDMLVGNLACRK
jgi:serine/threonine protein kinase